MSNFYILDIDSYINLEQVSRIFKVEDLIMSIAYSGVSVPVEYSYISKQERDTAFNKLTAYIRRNQKNVQ